MVGLKTSNVKFAETHIILELNKSKTEQYRDGYHVHIAKTNTEICPVECLAAYMNSCNLSSLNDEFLFRPFTYHKSEEEYRLRKSNHAISYSTIREQMLKLVSESGLNKSEIGFHSLRSGGATAAARYGISDRIFKRHGRWKSESVKDGYVKDELQQLLSVTLNLGV